MFVINQEISFQNERDGGYEICHEDSKDTSFL